MHALCRLTPYPVNINWTIGDDFAQYRCLNVPNFDYLGSAGSEQHTQSTSPWHTPQSDCQWPYDPDDRANGYLCSLNGQGFHHCIHDYSSVPVELWRWCGSDFDAWGNFRFHKQFGVFDYDIYVANLDFGFCNFDNIGKSFLFIFQTLASTNWSTLMYTVMDSTNVPFASLYCTFLIFAGTFVILQLLVAILAKNVVDVEKYDLHKKIDSTDQLELVGPGIAGAFLSTILGWCNCLDQSTSAWRAPLIALLETRTYKYASTSLVVLNTLVLAMVHYPQTVTFSNYIDAINFLFTASFGLELFVKLVAYGVLVYGKDPSMAFDGIIVFVSIIDLFVSPLPVLLQRVGMGAASSGSLSALRGFRLLRNFRMMLLVRSLKDLIKRIFSSVVSLANFFALLSLYLFVFALIGMQFFANRMRFDSNGFLISAVNSEAFLAAAVDYTRYNFDDFTHAVATIFQLMTLDNWVEVLYDCGRANGPIGFVFPILCVLVGYYIFYNLFIALLIGNFLADDWEDNEGNAVSEEEEMQEEVHSSPPVIQCGRTVGLQEQEQQSEEEEESDETRKEGAWDAVIYNQQSEGDGSGSVSALDSEGVSGVPSIRTSSPTKKPSCSTGDMEPSAIPSMQYKRGTHQKSKRNDKVRNSTKVLPSALLPALTPPSMSDADDVSDAAAAGTSKGPSEAVPTIHSSATGRYLRMCETWAANIVDNRYFDAVVLTSIFVSCICLALDNPLLNPTSTTATTLSIIEVVTSVVFMVEMISKMIAIGLFQVNFSILVFYYKFLFLPSNRLFFV